MNRPFRVWLRLPALLALLALPCAGSARAESPGDARGAPGTPRVYMGTWMLDLNYDIDCTLDVLGPTHFFSSRQHQNVGGRLMVHGGGKRGNSFWLGFFGGIQGTRNSFLLNWETPGEISYDPLDASITTVTFPLGLEANFALGRTLSISPYLGVHWAFFLMKLEVGDTSFNGTTSKPGTMGGVEVSLRLRGFRVTGGLGQFRVFGDEMEIDVDDMVFAGRFDGPSTEYYLGVTLP